MGSFKVTRLFHSLCPPAALPPTAAAGATVGLASSPWGPGSPLVQIIPQLSPSQHGFPTSPVWDHRSTMFSMCVRVCPRSVHPRWVCVCTCSVCVCTPMVCVCMHPWVVCVIVCVHARMHICVARKACAFIWFLEAGEGASRNRQDSVVPGGNSRLWALCHLTSVAGTRERPSPSSSGKLWKAGS